MTTETIDTISEFELSSILSSMENSFKSSINLSFWFAMRCVGIPTLALGVILLGISYVSYNGLNDLDPLYKSHEYISLLKTTILSCATGVVSSSLGLLGLNVPQDAIFDTEDNTTSQ